MNARSSITKNQSLNPYAPLPTQPAYVIRTPDQNKYELAIETNWNIFQKAMGSFLELNADNGYWYRLNGGQERRMSFDTEYSLFQQRLRDMKQQQLEIVVHIRAHVAVYHPPSSFQDLYPY